MDQIMVGRRAQQVSFALLMQNETVNNVPVFQSFPLMNCRSGFCVISVFFPLLPPPCSPSSHQQRALFVPGSPCAPAYLQHPAERITGAEAMPKHNLAWLQHFIGK